MGTFDDRLRCFYDRFNKKLLMTPGAAAIVTVTSTTAALICCTVGITLTMVVDEDFV
jgi:chromosome condensin MukBEF MukE localization factor